MESKQDLCIQASACSSGGHWGLVDVCPDGDGRSDQRGEEPVLLRAGDRPGRELVDRGSCQGEDFAGVGIARREDRDCRDKDKEDTGHDPTCTVPVRECACDEVADDS